MINAHLADEAVFEALMSQVLTGDFLSELLVETRKQITDTAPLDREIARVKNAQVELAPQALRIALDTWQARLAGAQDKGDLLTVKNFLARFFSKIEVGYHTVLVVYTYPAEPIDGR